MIDLHVHSTFSDGSYTPEELAIMAAKTGLTAVSLTDHDNSTGTARFRAACEEHMIRAITGVEMSAEVEKGTLHMLGYFIDPDEPELNKALKKIRGGRELRNHEIVKILNELGLELTWDEIAAKAAEDVVGRPHFAMALMEHNYVRTKQEAFDKYLAKGKPGYVDRFRLLPADAINLIRNSGGIAVLAHPFTLDLSPAALRDYVAELADIGLGGIESHYSEHSREQTEQYLALVKEFNLAASGGSDFHGEVNPAIKLGRGFGHLNVPDAVLEELELAKCAQR